jgi:hypothetical protein
MCESCGSPYQRERRKGEVASSFATEIAEAMVAIPERMVRSVLTGRDGEDRQFVAFTPPFPDYTNFTDEERAKMHTEWRRDVYGELSEMIRTGKELVRAQIACENFVGLIRYPKEIVESFPERRVAPEYHEKVVARIAIALLEEPGKWITEE